MDTRPPLRLRKTAIRNRRKHSVTVRLEPWGDVYDIAPGATVWLVALGPEGDDLELESGPQGFIAYAWPGASLRVERRGAELADRNGRTTRERQTAPWIPAGMRTREWLDAVAHVVG